MAMDKDFCCTTCPAECRLLVSVNEAGEFVSVRGNRCRRGEEFARQELILPMRVLTSTVCLKNGKTSRLVPVRSDRAFALSKHKQAVAELRGVVCEAPVRMGEVVAADIAGSGAAMLASCDAE